jgi:hypothetical protein
MLQILHDAMKSFGEEPEMETNHLVPQFPRLSQKEFPDRSRFNMQIFKGADH